MAKSRRDILTSDSFVILTPKYPAPKTLALVGTRNASESVFYFSMPSPLCDIFGQLQLGRMNDFRTYDGFIRDRRLHTIQP